MHDSIQEEMYEEIKKVIHSGRYLFGDKLTEFEKAFSVFCNVHYCAGVGSGFDALYLALRALGIGKGDEVILPAHSFIATAMAVKHTGAKPVMVDILQYEYTINPDKITEKISGRTKAIIAVHLYGLPCRMDDLLKIVKENNLYLIEDFAQAHGAKYKNNVVGSFGKVNATSFYPVKNMGALSDAGAITTEDSNIHKHIMLMRNYGASEKYIHDHEGINSRLDELQSAILLIKLNRLNEWNIQRRKIAAYYTMLLKDVTELTLPVSIEHCVHVYHQYVVRTTSRDSLRQHLAQKGIGTLVHYPVPMHLQGCMKEYGYKAGDFPIAEQVCNTCLSLPIYPGLSETEIEYIAHAIKEFFRNHSPSE